MAKNARMSLAGAERVMVAITAAKLVSTTKERLTAVVDIRSVTRVPDPFGGLEMIFADRVEAGQLLAHKLNEYANRSDVIILGLPRGGVPVAYEVAKVLDAPLDVFLVRKLGVPGHEELAMGAIASGGVRVLNDFVIQSLGIPEISIDRAVRREQLELERREQVYRGSQPPLNVRGLTAIIVDDGLATGSTMRAAVSALKLLEPAKIIVAAPVASYETCESFKTEVDSSCICVITPERFDGVGKWYQDFSQTTDEEVCTLLERAPRSEQSAAHV
jgi:putative phosphoribosyl transferase